MNNAKRFNDVFGIYATELWAMPEKEFLEWLNAKADLSAIRDESLRINKAYDDGCKTGYEQARFDYELKWIPVTERLPEEEGEYLTTVLLVSDSPTVFSVYFGYEDDDSTKMTFHRWDDEYWHCWKPDVIAWMPLPEPYKGEA